MNLSSKLRFTAEKGPTGKPVIHWGRVMDNRRGKPIKTNKNATRTVGRGKQAAREPQKPVARNPRTQQKGGSSDISPGTVTLTQAQLDAILSTVGSLMSENQILHNKNMQDEGELKDLKTARPDIPENILNLVNKPDGYQGEKPSSGRSYRGPMYVEPDEVPGLGIITKRDENDTRLDSMGIKTVAPSDVPGLGSEPPRAVDIPKAHMTKSELKRLQWERERAGVDVRSPLGDMQDSPLFGVGSRKPQPERHNSLAPIIPRAHLTKAERWRQDRAGEKEEASSNPVSSGRTLTQFWSNDIQASSSDGQLPPSTIPKAHLTKAERKRKLWEQERAENAERDAVLNKPPVPRTRQPETQHYSSLPPTGGGPPAGGVPRVHMTKAEQKRLQWEKERAENEALDKRQAFGQQQRSERKPEWTPNAAEGTAYVPSAGLSKAEIKRQQWDQERAENKALDQSQNVDQLQRNRTRKVTDTADEESTYVPSVGMSKAEIKRRQWEKERAENDARDNLQIGGQQQNNRRPPQFSPDADVRSAYVPTAATSKAELKRRQWEKERVENEGLGSWQIGGNQQPTHGRRAQQVLPDEDVGSPYVPKQVMSKADLKKLQWEKERAEAEGNNWSQVGQVNEGSQQGPGQGSKPPMSKGEMKRLQWQKERQEIQQAEQQGDYNPWGRPGAGAPIRDPSGNILSDYNQRQVSEKKVPPPVAQAEPLQSKWQY